MNAKSESEGIRDMVTLDANGMRPYIDHLVLFAESYRADASIRSRFEAEPHASAMGVDFELRRYRSSPIGQWPCLMSCAVVREFSEILTTVKTDAAGGEGHRFLPAVAGSGQHT